MDRLPKPTRPLGVSLFFFVNFSVAVVLGCLAVTAVAASRSPYDFLGGCVALLPISLYAVAEWRAWHRGQRSLYRVLGVLNLAAAAFTALGMAGYVLEQPQLDTPPPGVAFQMGVFLVGISTLGYLLTSGAYRLRYATRASDKGGSSQPAAGGQR